uniref:TSA: Wollemia nobilis Ref_Wollemi_Transcript_19717_836 transcribed RNA sequence n=1 Tax=Wollemia nobilis TaxID=56998 RepID=A0A0C9RHU3_9CONI
MDVTYYFWLVVILFISVAYQQEYVYAHGFKLQPKPDFKDAHATARWLVSQNTWGILSTTSIDLQGVPFGNVVSFSDGPPGKETGIPYFYLTSLDPTARDLQKDSHCSFTVSEVPLGTCKETDPENPTCSKLTLTGKMELIMNGPEADFAAQALFSKHGEMTDWPADHDFHFFKLVIENIFLIDWFGGPKPLSVEEYLQPGGLISSD